MMCYLCDSLCTSHCRLGGAYQCPPSNNFPFLGRRRQHHKIGPNCTYAERAYDVDSEICYKLD